MSRTARTATRHTLSIAIALFAALLLADSASAETVRVSASDHRAGTLQFQIADGDSLAVRRARLGAPGLTERPRLRAVRRGVRTGTVRLRIPTWAERRLRRATTTRYDRLLLEHRLRIRGPHKPTPTEPTPTEPAPTEPSIEPTATVASDEALPAEAYHLSPEGNDSYPGTLDRPWRTIQQAVSVVSPGDTVVLHAGTYGARGTTHFMSRPGAAAAPITFRGAPGETMPRILGFFKITAGYQRFSYMLFDGPTGPVKAPTTYNPTGEEVQVSIIGSAVNGIEISHSEIRNSDWHAGVFLSGANDAQILNNYIHGNGDETDPGQENQSHGIYWSSGSGLIANNVIEHNLARGVQLYKNPTQVTIANNTIVKNGKAGIQFGEATSNSLAVNNLVAYNDWGIRTADLSGSGNVAQNNVVWGNRSGNLALTDGLALSANRTVDAQFVGSTDYRLKSGSPAIDTAATAHAPARDFRLSARPVGAGPDLGAYEIE